MCQEAECKFSFDHWLLAPGKVRATCLGLSFRKGSSDFFLAFLSVVPFR